MSPKPLSRKDSMRKQYLQLSAYRCCRCAGPVVAGSIEVHENETPNQAIQIGAICLSCGHRQSNTLEPMYARHFSPVEWEPLAVIDARLATAFAESVDRAEIHRPAVIGSLMS
jgi:hypothetical protein